MVFLQNIPTPNQQIRKPDFRQSTALPKTYQQFVATVNSGLLQSSNGASQPAGSNPEHFKTTATNNQAGPSFADVQFKETRPQSKKLKKPKKDEVIKMIN
mgnify:CR=1 FL=1